MSNTLQRLLDASRPFKPFTATINGEVFNLFARKASIAAMQEISESSDGEYRKALEAYNEEDADTAPIFAALRRLSPEKLAKYVADADRRDFLADTLALLDKSEDTDPEVVAEVDRLVAERVEELKTLEAATLFGLATQRRKHFYALMKSNEIVSRKLASLLIFDDAKERLFPNPEDAAELSYDDLHKLVTDASTAVAEADADPLK